MKKILTVLMVAFATLSAAQVTENNPRPGKIFCTCNYIPEEKPSNFVGKRDFLADTCSMVLLKWQHMKWQPAVAIRKVLTDPSAGSGMPTYNSIQDLIHADVFAPSLVLSFQDGHFKGGGIFAPVQKQADHLHSFTSLVDPGRSWQRIITKACLDAIDLGAVGAPLTLQQLGWDLDEVQAVYGTALGISPSDHADWAALQIAMKASQMHRHTCVDLTPMKYHINKNLAESKRIDTEIYFRKFNGAELVASGNSQPLTFIQKTVADQSEAGVEVNSAGFYEGVVITGRNNGDTAVEIEASYGMIFEKSRIRSTSYGIITRFGLMGCIRNNLFTNNGTTSIISTWGNWQGATNSNSQSNHTLRMQNRIYGSTNQVSFMEARAVSGLYDISNIMEGHPPSLAAWIFDADNSNVVKDFRAVNNHVECPATKNYTAFRVKMKGGYGILDGIYQQHDCTLIDASGTYAGYPHLYVKNIPWLDTAPSQQMKFKGSGVIWSVTETPTNIFTEDRWIQDGTRILPYYRFTDYFQQQKIMNGAPDIQINSSNF